MISVLIIAFIIVYIVDYSGIILDLSKWLYILLHKGKKWNYQILKKPWSCSSCLSLWITLIYLLLIGYTILNSLLLAVFSASILNILIKRLYELIVRIINKIQ
jgi:hypothetical protein